MSIKKYINISIVFAVLIILQQRVYATNYTVSTKTDLQNKMTAALPGDTVIVVNGTYNWGQFGFNNTKGNSTSKWIVLKAETRNGVVFTGNTFFQFGGKRIMVTGFKFANGKAGLDDVIQFRSPSGTSADYCRLNNITIENYSSDSTGAAAGLSTSIDNKWVSLFGTNNRVDHCTFIDKFNAGATVVVWYDNNTYPQLSTPTYHKIDSNYFKKRSFMGGNGGESMRIGVSTTSRTKGFNTIEYNLFENCTQTEPEIISNKSGFNTYRYNSFKNCDGGLTLRHGRYCSVYGNFFIVDNPTRTNSYGIRVIDKGHQIYNNYLEGILGNKNKLTSLRCPIILYNGLSATTDTTDPTKAAGYFPTDSVTVAFNTIVNCSGGAGIVLGFNDNGANIYQPLGIKIVNNLIKMTSGQTAYNPPTNTQLTYTAEGNIHKSPNGLGFSSFAGFTEAVSLNFSTRTNGILTPPSLVQDAAINTGNYVSLLNGLDANGKTRSATFDVGCNELNGTGNVVASPLDSTQVGAGTPLIVTPVHLISFNAIQNNNLIQLHWKVENEINFLSYAIEKSNNGVNFENIGNITANNSNNYIFEINNPNQLKQYFRLKLINQDGTFQYSSIVVIRLNDKTEISLYPNPAKDFVSINVNTLTPNTYLVLNDFTGRIISKILLTETIANFSTRNLVTGMYTVQLLQNNQIIKTIPFIIASN
jgi:poly(beta-D-mannuronate) lyase